MGYTPETLGAFSVALRELYSLGEGNQPLSCSAPETVLKNAPSNETDTGDDAYLASLLRYHSLLYSVAASEQVGGDMKKTSSPDFSRLAAIGLTSRECEVVTWIAQGKRDAEIALILGLAVKTVSKHVEHLLAKLNVESRAAAASVVCERLTRS
jgi:DNA-binding NarL/FixJ family response regulator